MARKSRRTVENIVQAEAAHSDIKRYPTAICKRSVGHNQSGDCPCFRCGESQSREQISLEEENVGRREQDYRN